MFRKTTLALATLASLGAAALIPTAALAGPHGGHGHFGHGFFRGGFGLTIVDTSAASCWQLVKVAPRTYQKVWVCN